MIKTARSWSKPEDIPNLIGREKIDQSIFKYGTHIPLIFHENFRNANKGHLIELVQNLLLYIAKYIQRNLLPEMLKLAIFRFL